MPRTKTSRWLRWFETRIAPPASGRFSPAGGPDARRRPRGPARRRAGRGDTRAASPATGLRAGRGVASRGGRDGGRHDGSPSGGSTIALLDQADDLVEVQARGVDDAGVGGRLHRGDGAGGVAVVAVAEVARDGVAGRSASPRAAILGVSAAGALVQAGREEELAEGVGEDDRPLVAALGHDVVLGGELALQPHEPAADPGAVGQIPRGPGDLDASRIRIRDVLAVEQDPAGWQARPRRRSASAPSASSLARSIPARIAARVTARYIAPVSSSRQPSRSARSRATVLLPAPAGPSIVTTFRIV